MRYRQLGRTGLMVSEIGYGPEWLEGKTREEGKAIADRCMEHGINICDCWMSDPEVRSNLGDPGLPRPLDHPGPFRRDLAERAVPALA